MIRSVSKTQTQDRDVNAIQEAILGPLNEVLKNQLNNSTLLEGVVLTTGTNLINHQLDHKLIGWFVTRLSAAVTIYDTQGTNDLSSRTLRLVASGACVVDLFVF